MSRAPAVMARIVIPRGRSAAEQRLAAIAALHQPVVGSGKSAPSLGPPVRSANPVGPAPRRCCLGHGPAMRKPPVPDRHPCPHYGRVRDRAVRADVRRVGAKGHQFSPSEGRNPAV